jgi:2-haloacid dehalogenase
MTPRAVLFDAYGTLFDVYSVAMLAEQLYPGRGEALSLLWRDKQIEYTRLITMSERLPQPAQAGAGAGAEASSKSTPADRYRPFWDITRSALRYACAKLRLELQPQMEERLMNQYRHLSTFPENREVLAELKRLRVPTGILSNGDPDMLEVAVKSAGLAPLLKHVISVHPARRFKTDPAAYALGTQALKLPARDILFVSSNAWDAIGATWFGYTTLWVNRQAAPPEQLGTQPTHTGRTLRDVLALFAPA